MPDDPTPGRALATRRAVVDIVRAATLGSYGIAGFAGSPLERLSATLDGRPPGVRVSIDGDRLRIRLHLRIVHGLPVAEVARQVDSAVRHAIRRAFGREIEQLAIRVGALETATGTPPPATPARGRRRRTDAGDVIDLAGSGMDVA